MQNNDSRLIKAAKRTIRAEITLIIVIIVIASWSVYALYKLAFGGGDTLFGLSLTKLTTLDNVVGHNAIDQQKNSTQLKSAISSSPQRTAIANDDGGQAIYSASNVQTKPQREQFNNIQSLLAPANQHLIDRPLVLGAGRGGLLVGAPVQPFAMSSHANNLIPNYGNQNLMQHLMSAPNRAPDDLTNQLMIAPAANNLYGRTNLPLIQPPMAGPVGSRHELDYDLPNYEGKQEAAASLDYSTDRQAEESNTKPGEAVVENSPSDDREQDSTGGTPATESDASPSDQDDSNETTTDDSQQPETTSASPVSESDDPSTDREPDKNQSDSGDDNNNNEERSSSDSEEPSEENKEVSPADEESAKEAGLSIDEEVDRMTQPSLGSVSQQDRPFNYKNTVQFDDSPMSSTGDFGKRNRPEETGIVVAQFADPQAAAGSKRTDWDKNKKESPDLQVDHDTVRVGTSADQSRKSKPTYNLVEMINKKRQSRRRGKPESRAETSSKVISDGHKTKKILVRQRRHLDLNVIRAPYEIDGFLNKLDIDQHIERSFEQPDQTRRNLRVALGQGRENIKEGPEGSLEAAPSERLGMRTAPGRLKKQKKKEKNNNEKKKNRFMRRSDDEEDDDDDGGEEESGGDENGAGAEDENGTDDSSPTRWHRSSGQPLDPRYHYITSNDTTLQDLLTRQRLLEALRNSQPPAPTLGGPNQHHQTQMNQTGAGDATSSQPQVSTSPAVKAADHQQAGSLYSVDHGLLLYPASNDDYESKSMSKKKKKHEKKKEKKKMTVAFKKGGHKKKKHKKEEKKFMKEKKFKGAKKGKKVSKGKGGQGGKKGKKLYKDKGFKKKGFKNVYHKEEFGQKKSYFDEFRDKDFKKKWKKFDDKYNYAQMKKWQAKDVKGAKKMKDHGEKFKKYDKGKWKKKYHKQSKEHSESSKKHKKSDGF